MYKPFIHIKFWVKYSTLCYSLWMFSLTHSYFEIPILNSYNLLRKIMFSLYVWEDSKGYSQKAVVIWNENDCLGSDLHWCSMMLVAELGLILQLTQYLAHPLKWITMNQSHKVQSTTLIPLWCNTALLGSGSCCGPFLCLQSHSEWLRKYQSTDD